MIYFRGRAAASGDGLGGWLVSGGAGTTEYLDSTEIFKDRFWKEGPNLPSYLINHCQVEVNGKVIITGGYNVAGITNQTLVMEVDTWNSVASMNNGRDTHACVEFEGEAFVFGGLSTSNYRLASVEIYNPAADSWRNGPDLPIALSGPQAFVHEDVIYVLGGDGSSGYNKQIFYLSGPDYNTWDVLSVALAWNSARVFTNPPFLTKEMMFC